jgi:hypothetical protein
MTEPSLSNSAPPAVAAQNSPKEKEKDKEKEAALNELNFENLRSAVLDLQTEFPQSVPALNKVVELLTSFEIARDFQNERLGREMRDKNRFRVQNQPDTLHCPLNGSISVCPSVLLFHLFFGLFLDNRKYFH